MERLPDGSRARRAASQSRVGSCLAPIALGTLRVIRLSLVLDPYPFYLPRNLTLPANVLSAYITNEGGRRMLCADALVYPGVSTNRFLRDTRVSSLVYPIGMRTTDASFLNSGSVCRRADSGLYLLRPTRCRS